MKRSSPWRQHTRQRSGQQDAARPRADIHKFTGTILRIKFGPNESGWVAGTIQASDHDLAHMMFLGFTRGIVPFNGVLGDRFREGDQVIVRGRVEKHEKYGEQFRITEIEHDRAVATGGLEKFLAAHPALRGIGPAKAARLVEHFGDGLTAACRETPSAVAEAVHVEATTVERLLEVLEQDQVIFETKTWLASLGLTFLQVTKLTDKYGWQTRQILETNPYQLMDEVERYGFRRADDVARKIGTALDHPGRIRAGILYCVGQAVEDGHTWIPRDGRGGLIEQAYKLLVLDTLDARDRIGAAIDELIGTGRLVSKDVAAGAAGEDPVTAIAETSMYSMESAIRETLAQHAQDEHHLIPPAAIAALNSNPGSLNMDQVRAVYNALTNRISLISGGAGSGKTFLIRRIAEIFTECGRKPACCAPTGKAARRIEESTGFTAQTIHKMLGYDGRDWVYGPDCPLKADVVIVDEFSMVDVPLFYRLIQAIDLSRTALVVVGDHNQLPPVGPGYPLRDMIQHRLAPTTILQHIHRHAGILKENSCAILEGQMRETPPKRDENQALPWYLFTGNALNGGESFTDIDHLKRFLFGVVEHHLDTTFGYDLLADVQILCPQNKGRLGTLCLNKSLQRIIQRKLYDIRVSGRWEDDADDTRRPQFLAGDKVIQLKNDYELQINNGDIGIISRIEGKSLFVQFDGREVRITAGKLGDLALAYAITVHKFQGSQVPCSIFLCHRTNYIMLNRNLAYTAATRSTKTTIILGDGKGIRYAMQKNAADAGERRTWMGATRACGAPLTRGK